MARMHTRRRGKSGSTRPVHTTLPKWSNVKSKEIEKEIVKLSKDGYAPSEIGLKLRDEGISGVPVPSVKLATGKKITKILLKIMYHLLKSLFFNITELIQTKILIIL